MCPDLFLRVKVSISVSDVGRVAKQQFIYK